MHHACKCATYHAHFVKLTKEPHHLIYFSFFALHSSPTRCSPTFHTSPSEQSLFFGLHTLHPSTGTQEQKDIGTYQPTSPPTHQPDLIHSFQRYPILPIPFFFLPFFALFVLSPHFGRCFSSLFFPSQEPLSPHSLTCSRSLPLPLPLLRTPFQPPAFIRIRILILILTHLVLSCRAREKKDAQKKREILFLETRTRSK